MLRLQPTISILLVMISTVSCFNAQISFRTNRNIQANARTRHPRLTDTSLSLGDPVHLSHHLQQSSILDILSTSLSPDLIATIPHPNESLSPLTATVTSGITTIPNEVTTIPDLTSLPGGAPRSGNSFLAESFRYLYNGPIKASPNVPPATEWAGNTGDNTLYIPAKEFDLVGRYADLLSRIPLAAAVYALVDFFLVNAEEDVVIAEMMDDTEVENIMEVEGKVIETRLKGLGAVVVMTLCLSSLLYHPVPFHEL